MSEPDYSQLGEQREILQWAAHAGQGSFLDLGCYDGATYSNTAALADRGWPGILVDASPDAIAACAQRYMGRDDITVICGAFTVDGEDIVTVHWVPGTMYSSLTPSRRSDVTLVPVQVAALNLDSLGRMAANLPAPLFCSIDLEGVSIDALRWLLTVADPACVCVEANIPAERAAARDLLDGWRERPLAPHHSNLLFERVQVPA